MTHRRIAPALLMLAALLLAPAGAVSPVLAEDPQQEKKEEQKTVDAEEEAAKQEEEKEDEETERATKQQWLGRWGRFRQATRDITEWDLKEGMFRMRFGLRLQIDATAARESEELSAAVGSIEESLKLRRGRLFADGDLLRRYHFRFEYDFAADAGLKDAYIDNLLRYRLKFVAMRAGNFQEPFSLENATSSYDKAFLEDPLPVAAFAPGFNLGLALYGAHLQGRLAWTLGGFTSTHETDDNRSASDITLTTRVTGLPLYRKDGRRLVHLGASYSLRDPKGGSVRYASRPEARFAPFFLDTGDLAADDNQLAGLEAAWVQGSFWLQAELVGTEAGLVDFGDRRFLGGYAQAGWFLTGEHRPYNHADGTIGRLEPRRPYRWGGNPFKKGSDGGAFELLGRASWLDLNDGPVQDGKMADLSFGMNWYLTRATRVLFNYVRSRVQDDGHADIFLIRYQFNPGYNWPPLDPRWRNRSAPQASAPEKPPPG
jgi:phosphate-selective porin OprO/OprP